MHDLTPLGSIDLTSRDRAISPIHMVTPGPGLADPPAMLRVLIVTVALCVALAMVLTPLFRGVRDDDAA